MGAVFGSETTEQQEENLFQPRRSGWHSPPRHEGHVDSSVTSDHIVAKEVRPVDTQHNLRPCKEMEVRGALAPGLDPLPSTHSQKGWCS